MKAINRLQICAGLALVLCAGASDAAHSVEMKCAKAYEKTLYRLHKSSEALNNSGFSLPVEQERLLAQFETLGEQAMRIKVTEAIGDAEKKTITYMIRGPEIEDRNYRTSCQEEIFEQLCPSGSQIQADVVTCRVR